MKSCSVAFGGGFFFLIPSLTLGALIGWGCSAVRVRRDTSGMTKSGRGASGVLGGECCRRVEIAASPFGLFAMTVGGVLVGVAGTGDWTNGAKHRTLRFAISSGVGVRIMLFGDRKEDRWVLMLF